MALEALVNPRRHPLQLCWVLRTKASLPRELWREIRTLSFAYTSWQPGFFSVMTGEEIPSFEEAIGHLTALGLEEFVAEVARGFAPPQEDLTAWQVMHDPTVQQALVEGAARKNPLYAEVAHQLISDPEQVRHRLVTMLESFWSHVFANQWASIEPALAEDIASRAKMLQEMDLYDFFRRLLPGCRTVRSERLLVFQRVFEASVDLDDHDQLLLVPSFFTWARTRIECDPPWTPGFVYPAGNLEGVLTALPSDTLMQVLQAVANETRLHILRLCAEAPRSTQELAKLLGQAEGGVSRHIRLLQEAGLVAPQRQSYYVLYRAVPGRLRAISPALRRFVEHAD